MNETKIGTYLNKIGSRITSKLNYVVHSLARQQPILIHYSNIVPIPKA